MTEIVIPSAVTTSIFRRLMAAQMSGGAPVEPVTYIVFGDGAISDDGQILSPNPEHEQIYNQILEKPIDVVTVVDNPFWIECTGLLDAAEMVGQQLNEVGILDGNRNLLCHKTFSTRTKEAEERYQFKVYLKF